MLFGEGGSFVVVGCLFFKKQLTNHKFFLPMQDYSAAKTQKTNP